MVSGEDPLPAVGRPWENTAEETGIRKPGLRKAFPSASSSDPPPLSYRRCDEGRPKLWPSWMLDDLGRTGQGNICSWTSSTAAMLCLPGASAVLVDAMRR
ncbi:hypothetical protein MAPG_00093 [Magnaporthiopsis poae ATCC 64411]|uniref:Uncharacterized protein n=1 Tax=Magnaporthiopsis poae (strain ATCC 64411 / 73-15) TaxID=644358 RepID=A0A0C4DK31_MAGP6|nr:hypothetical protein MAPG_00093 [Magnaporthiopsis poae ATCC 64411]